MTPNSSKTRNHLSTALKSFAAFIRSSLKRLAVSIRSNYKWLAAFIGFLVSLWTFHWSIDSTLQHYEHELIGEATSRLEDALESPSVRSSTSSSTATEAHAALVSHVKAFEEARWARTIHRLLAHDTWISHLVFHPPWTTSAESGSSNPDDIRLQSYERYREMRLQETINTALDRLFNPPPATSREDIHLLIDSLVAINLLLDQQADANAVLSSLEEQAPPDSLAAEVLNELRATLGQSD